MAVELSQAKVIIINTNVETLSGNSKFVPINPFVNPCKKYKAGIKKTIVFIIRFFPTRSSILDEKAILANNRIIKPGAKI